MFDFKLLGRPGMVPIAARIAAEKVRTESLRAAAARVRSKDGPQAAVAPPGGDDETDRADFANPKTQAIARRQKARVLAILTSPAGIRNPLVAVNVAMMTALPRSQAITLIEELASSLPSSASAKPRLAERIITAGNRRRGEEPMAPSAPEQGEGRRATASEIIAAGKKRRGE